MRLLAESVIQLFSVLLSGDPKSSADLLCSMRGANLTHGDDVYVDLIAVGIKQTDNLNVSGEKQMILDFTGIKKMKILYAVNPGNGKKLPQTVLLSSSGLFSTKQLDPGLYDLLKVDIFYLPDAVVISQTPETEFRLKQKWNF